MIKVPSVTVLLNYIKGFILKIVPRMIKLALYLHVVSCENHLGIISC